MPTDDDDHLRAEIARLTARLQADRDQLFILQQMLVERQRLRGQHNLGIIPGVTTAQIEAAQRKRRGHAVASAKAAKSGNAVAVAIAASKWRSITAYAKRLKISQPALSRYIAGGLECPAEVADHVRLDFGLGDDVWPRPPRR